MSNILSMTGFGKYVGEFENKKITAEIKSLNSKSIDCIVRIPMLYREKELEIRNLIADKLIRGKIELLVIVEITENEQISTINEKVFLMYYRQFENIYKQLGKEFDSFAVANIMRIPEVLETKYEELSQEEWLVVKQIIEKSIENCIKFRETEGDALCNDIMSNIKSLNQFKNLIEPLEPLRSQTAKDRLLKILDETVGVEKIDSNRLEQELIYYIEKFDINEEMTRLEQHLKYFMETISNEYNVGRKLNFITQEIGREINTLGAKAYQSEMQKIVVEMKNELEKIKEQIMNIL